MTTYVIADLHGRFDLLLMALKKIDEIAEPHDTVVFTGDYVDRGPESANILTTLRLGADAYHGKDRDIEWVCLLGNHEEWFIDVMDANPGTQRVVGAGWIDNGGGRTLMSYGAPGTSTITQAVEYVNREDVNWLKSLPLIHVDDHRVYVHAAIDETLELHEQKRNTLLWQIYPKYSDQGYRGLHLVHGHDQYEDGPLLYKNRTDLDTKAWATGRLVIGVFDDEKAGGPVEVIEIIGEPAGPRYVRVTDGDVE